MKPKEIILKAFARSKKERGLRVIAPSSYLCSGHMRKADHNLVVMTDLNKLGYEDWVVITAYYAMYHAAMSLLAKIGLLSKDHATTVAILEYFFSKQISKKLLEEFDKLKKKKDKIEEIIIEEKYIDYLWRIKRARETVQYGISISFKETLQVISNARDFVSKIKIVLEELDEEILTAIRKEIGKLKKLAGKL